MEQTILDIRAGLRALGYNGSGSARETEPGRYLVVVGAERVGIWDVNKRNFVD